MTEKISSKGIPQFDGSAVTQPVSAVSLPLPSGAAEESGNLATIAAIDFATETTASLIKGNTDNLDILLSDLRDALTGASPDNKTLQDLYDQIQALIDISSSFDAYITGGENVITNYDLYGTHSVLTADIALDTAGDNIIIPCETNFTYKVISGNVMCAGKVTLQWKRGATEIGGPMPYGVTGSDAATGFIIPYNPEGEMVTLADDEDLIVSLSDDVQVSGWLRYVKIDIL